MFISILGVYQNVIYKHHHKLVQVGSEKSIDKIHKSYKGIGEAKRHHCKFIMTIPDFKSGFKDGLSIQTSSQP